MTMYQLTKTAHVLRIADATLIYPDPDTADYAAYLEWIAEGNTPAEAPGPTFAQRTASMLAVVECRLNEAARRKGYDGILSAALRAGYPGPFHDEGVAFATWMDATYHACYSILAQVQAGEIPEPTEAELLEMLPALELP
jgi:hypothetical protein